MKSIEARRQLWIGLSPLFEEDDGSLPEVRLVGVSSAGASRIYNKLRFDAEPLTPRQTVWDTERDQEVQLSEVADAGRLAAEGKFYSLHVVLRGIHARGVRVPDLGVRVESGEIALDYHPGEEWNETTVSAFVELLGDLLQLDADAELDLEEFVTTEMRERFRRSVDAYLATA